MRIDLQSSIREAGSAASCRGGSQTAIAKQSSAKAGEAAEVSWNRAGVKSLMAAALRAPEIRQEKVAALAQRIREGSYEVGSQELAGAMIAHMGS